MYNDEDVEDCANCGCREDECECNWDDNDEDDEELDPSKPYVKLVGRDGNAFAIMGNCQQAARKAKWTQEKISEVMKEMMSGDYNHLLATAMKYFDVH